MTSVTSSTIVNMRDGAETDWEKQRCLDFQPQFCVTLARYVRQTPHQFVLSYHSVYIRLERFLTKLVLEFGDGGHAEHPERMTWSPPLQVSAALEDSDSQIANGQSTACIGTSRSRL